MHQYPNVCELLEVGLCIPVSSVPCESGFFQKRIETKVRGSLSTESLSMLMKLGLGHNVDSFDYAAAVSHWKKEKRKRLACLYEPFKPRVPLLSQHKCDNGHNANEDDDVDG